MCVICASPAGVRQPTCSEIRRMFTVNPHGAGYMVARDGKVFIHKGFMDIDSLLNALRGEHFTARDSVVYHFRISTQAGVNPEMTHPFPLSNRLPLMKALDVRCGCGVAHNGIIWLTTDRKNTEYSDTALFITQYLTDLIHSKADLKDEATLHTIEALIGSKMAILDGSGDIATVGRFHNDRGLLYSNLNHRF